MKNGNLIDFINNVSFEIDIFKEHQNLVDKKESKIISELVMHKILYFIYGGFYKNFKKELWDPKFEAWQYGPVEVQYREISLYALNNNYHVSEDLLKKKFLFNESNFTDEEIKYLKNLIIALIKMGVYNLVEFSHETDPWINNSNKIIGQNKIDKKEIKDYFKSKLII